MIDIPKSEGHPYFTVYPAELVVALLMNAKIKSYLELGSGHGYVLAKAANAMKEIYHGVVNRYKAYGIEHRQTRVDYSINLLKKYNVSAEVLYGNALTYDWKTPIESIFIDVGHRNNQLMIDKYSPYVSRLFIVHDAVERYKFPEGFTAIYIFSNKVAFAYKNDL